MWKTFLKNNYKETSEYLFIHVSSKFPLGMFLLLPKMENYMNLHIFNSEALV